MATPEPVPEYPTPPKPGTPEFLALIERHKDYIEQQTGIRPEVLLDVDPLDDFQRVHRRPGAR